MRVRMQTGMCTHGATYNAGDVVELDDAVARRYIQDGRAVMVGDEPAPKKKTTRKKRTKRTATADPKDRDDTETADEVETNDPGA